MVAKSYQVLEQVGEPYLVGDKQYVKVLTKKGTEKQVRWYSDAEYRKMYGESGAQSAEDIKYLGVDGNDHRNDPYFKTQKELLGFKEGFIWIFKGDTYPVKDWFKEHGATFRKFWGWSIPGGEALPEVLPANVIPVKLEWKLVGNDETEKLLPDDQVTAAVETLFYEPDESEFVGEVGDKLELYLTVEKIVPLDSYYGPSNMYLMRDDCGNAFVWITAPKDWIGGEGEEVALKGTVKEHKVYKNTKQTILTRCRAM